MKIICSDNYDREAYDDILVAENVNKNDGELIVVLLNNNRKEHDEIYYKLVKDSYKLYKFEP